LILVFGAFVNAAGMTEPVIMWMHRWHARLALHSILPVITALYAGGLLIVPAILAAACGWASLRWSKAGTTWKDLTCGFTLTLVPVGFAMWLAHFSNHLLVGWSAFLPPLGRFLSRVIPAAYPQASIPDWLPSLELLLLDLGLLLSLYTAWRVAGRLFKMNVKGDRAALRAMSPWAALTVALYSAGVWIVFQPMQMRGMMMMR
jgi:hypothetical protein